MGWTCGFVISSAHDVANYFYDLLGPEYNIVSKESVEVMKQLRVLDIGWSAGSLKYGGGLMEQNYTPT